MLSEPVLVTGGAGYVGSVLVHRLLEAGRSVRVVDSLRFGGESLLPVLGHPRFELLRADLREPGVPERAVAGAGAVIHLAAIVGDPACAAVPGEAREVNHDATVRLYEAADEAGVERFVFASTCSNYGRLADPTTLADEERELAPISIYAETKVACERFLLAQPPGRRTAPVCLRFATAYGLSPRPRFDLTLNEFTRDLVLGREVQVYGKQFWRPYCHVQDMAQAMIRVLEAPRGAVGFEVFNVGDTAENYTKGDLVAAILAAGATGRVVEVHRQEDPRDYRVRFDKIRDRLGFAVRRRVPDGIREIARAILEGVIADPFDARWTNREAAPERRAVLAG